MRERATKTTTDALRPRAVLFLSMIVLLYNLAAFARQDFFCTDLTAFLTQDVSFPVPSAQGPEHPLQAQGAKKGPLSLRQKFLLGLRVDVNKASWREISELPGLSDKVAMAVVAERNRVGRFRNPDDLLEVPGIKEKRLQIILPFLARFDNN